MKKIRITDTASALAYLASVGEEAGPLVGTWNEAQGGWIMPDRCTRCGGFGSSDKWAYTGGTCFDCGGADTRGRTRLESAVSYARAVKAYHTKAEKAQRGADDNLKAARAWLAENGLEWLEEASHRIHMNLMAKVFIYGSLSAAQIELAHKVAADELALESVEYPMAGSAVTFHGIVSAVDMRTGGDYGTSWAVKVKTDGGWTAVMFTTAKALRELERGVSVAISGTVGKVGKGWVGVKRPKLLKS
jgi:predicted  nucleic acid-binding Zn-ribbon protein